MGKAIIGINDSALGFALSKLIDIKSELTLVVSHRLPKSELALEDALFFLGGNKKDEFKLLSLPAEVKDESGSGAFESSCDLITVISELKYQERPILLACTPESLRRPCPSLKVVNTKEIRIAGGMKISLRELSDKLAEEFDYMAESVCESPGQYSLRGGLLDVYPLNASAPIRIDFFGDEIECIREYDPDTQRTIRKIPSAVIASGKMIEDEELIRGALYSYFPKKTKVVFLSPDYLNEAVPTDLLKNIVDFKWDFCAVSDFEDLPKWLPEIQEKKMWASEDLGEFLKRNVSEKSLGVDFVEETRQARAHLFTVLQKFFDAKEIVAIICENEGSLSRVKEILKEEYTEKTIKKKFSPQFYIGNISAGFRVETENGCFVYATEKEIFGREKRRISNIRNKKSTPASKVEQLFDFTELAEGDYLVHLQYGVCRFKGIKKVQRMDRDEEMIALEFDDGMLLYVPFREAHLISRYVGLRKAVPKLNKLGSKTWSKTMKSATDATIDFAADLLQLQAKRQTLPGIAMRSDEELPWIEEFEKSFPFTETADQMKAIVDTKKDQEKSSPMDRLICGDVGFGKTEVAIRAAFKAVLCGYQVAFLAPTTVLAQQHFNTFRDRFARYPISIEMLSRFRSITQRKAILKQLGNGDVDIVIGTHALLANTVKFEKLGLLIIDEEHRFGVKQKERIKQFRENVDVIAMSATPIPRTLYMALMGARDLSVIETAPRERLPIRTMIRNYDHSLIREAILHEIKRGGQVFFLHNRVDTIYEVASLLEMLVPEAKITIGHGQMHENELESIMTEFVAGKYDVLVCTTIIETGLDIPNCNTIIIDGADKFGLSQLYQLRGRVGRFNRQAYAYLLLHDRKIVQEIAHKRLNAIRHYNELGAGFRIAMRDLELRGAGNLLGVKQSGHIAGVGFELYCLLLKQSISKMSGKEDIPIFRCEINLDFVQYSKAPEIKSDYGKTAYQFIKEEENAIFKGDTIIATLPEYYIKDIRVRIEMFRKMAMAVYESEIVEIAEMMEDRFGKMPREVKTFVEMSKIRCICESHGIIELSTELGLIKAKKLSGEYLRNGTKMPRLVKIKAIERLSELKAFLQKLP